MNRENRKNQRASFHNLTQEPYRLFFPQAILAALAGVLLWPLHFAGIVAAYPGQNHARIMAGGFFGGFIFGFLGTAMPRMLSTDPLRGFAVVLLMAVHAAMVVCFATNHTVAGDLLLLVFLVAFAVPLIRRARQRKDNPPPGFVLVGLGLACMMTGALLGAGQHFIEASPFWILMQKLLCYQGFVLLPILGIGPFILPRFFGMASTHDFPDSLTPSRDWLRKAALALAAGAIVLGSFVLEAAGWYRAGYGLRFLSAAGYFLLEFSFARAPKASHAFGASLRIAFALVFLGFLAIAIEPVFRTGLLHLTLVGGFAVVTFTVATRVVFGHSGKLAELQGRNGWLLVAIALMLLGLATRISGDFWPKIMQSHYNAGAILWIGGVVLWSWRVLPNVLVVEAEEG